MHEFSICEQIVQHVLKCLQQIPSARLISVKVVIGCFRQVHPEYLIDAYNILTKGTKAEGSVLHVEISFAHAKCKQCGWQGKLNSITYTCTECGAQQLEFNGGMECYIESLEISEDSNNYEKQNVAS